jgi:hypothetical protein
MKSGRAMSRLFLVAGVLWMAAPATPVSTPRALGSDNFGQVARYDGLRPLEVRLRKLHLVRPDLIPYPIEYEVVC